MNRYYTAITSLQTWNDVRNKISAPMAWRVLPHELLHWRVSIDGSLVLFQADTDDAEHADLVARKGVTYLGAFNETTGQPDQAVRDYLAANPALWGPGA